MIGSTRMRALLVLRYRVTAKGQTRQSRSARRTRKCVLVRFHPDSFTIRSRPVYITDSTSLLFLQLSHSRQSDDTTIRD